MPPRSVDLIETMAFDPEAGLTRIERHLERMKASASAFGTPFDRHGARNELQAATFRLRRRATVRLVLGASGAIAIEVAPLPALPPSPVPVALLPLPVAPDDWRRRHRCADRTVFDAARRGSGAFEAVFVDGDGEVAEGSRSSVFVRRGDLLVTPPQALGFATGVLRGELIAAGEAVEGRLTPDDLAGGFLIGNAVHGLLPAVVAAQQASL